MTKTSFDVAMLATPNIDHYAAATQANWQSYCDRHGYAFTCWREVVLDDMHLIWSKIEWMRRHMRDMTADWLAVVDADTMVNKPERSLEALVQAHPGKDFLISEDCTRRFGIPVPLSARGVLSARSLRPPNCGFMIIRRSDFGKRFVDDWLANGRGKLSHIADVFPREQWVLWLSLFREQRQRIAVLGPEVMRIGNNPLLDRITPDWSDAFVLHDKRLPQCRSLSVEDLPLSKRS
ncbi:MAG: hypothetical protein WBM46_04140 [Polyangiales bacterium]|jgi:hypothetical protein